MSVRDYLRNLVYRGLFTFTGPGWGLRVILLYHSVGMEAPHSVTLPMFEKQMKSLVRRFRVVQLKNLPAALASESADTNIASVTFDDGYLDNYVCALPVLERLGIKATFFIATGFLSKSITTFAGEWPVMTNGQVRELAALGHEIGAHTVTHPKLTMLSPETALAEVEGAKQFLEELLADKIVSFAYPKGEHNEAVKTLIGSVGFKIAVTTREGLVDGNSDWLALPRIWVSNKLTLKAFEGKISPALSLYVQLRRQS